MQPETRKLLSKIIRIILFSGLFVVLYKQVAHSDDVSKTFEVIQQNVKGRYMLLIFVVLLMLLNWTMETLKWKTLVNILDKITFLRSFAGILFGIAFSLFTPNRLGEYGGRVLVLRHNRITAIVATLVGSYSQIVINMTVGGMAFILYLIFLVHLQIYWLIAIVLIYIILSSVLLLSYYNLDIFAAIFHKYSLFKKIAPHTDIVSQYKAATLHRLLVLSFFRYAIYCWQFYLLLHFFKAGIVIAKAVFLVPAVFFIQSVMPSLAILDISLRSEVSLHLMANIEGDNALAVVAATVTLWLINLIIPALAGGLAAVGFRFLDDETP